MVAWRIDIGKTRLRNEDSLLVGDALFAVADGMGGHNGGKEASENVLKKITDALAGEIPNKGKLVSAIADANSHICQMQLDNEALSGMGTTLSLLWQ